MTRFLRAIRFPRALSAPLITSGALALLLTAGHALADDMPPPVGSLQPPAGLGAAPGQTPGVVPAVASVIVPGGVADVTPKPGDSAISVPGGAAGNITGSAPVAGGMAEVAPSATNANAELAGIQLLPSVERPLHHFYCVEYARLRSGLQIFGDAKLWWERARDAYAKLAQPVTNAVMVFAGSQRIRRGHVAVVTQLVSPREIRVDQANWQNHGEIDHSTPVLDVSPNNDWSAVRVWDMTTGQYGGHVYAIKGFITRALAAQTKT